MKKVTKAQVIAKLKKLNEGEILPVTLFPSKCGPSNTTWVQGFTKELTKQDLLPLYPDSKEIPDLTGLDSLVNNYQYYNCIPELGKRVHFYINE
jgi:hypothetical protein